MFLTLFFQNSKTNKTVIVGFATFRHRIIFCHKRKALRGRVTVHFNRTKSRLDLLIKASKNVHSAKLTAVSKSDLGIEERSFMIQYRI